MSLSQVLIHASRKAWLPLVPLVWQQLAWKYAWWLVIGQGRSWVSKVTKGQVRSPLVMREVTWNCAFTFSREYQLEMRPCQQGHIRSCHVIWGHNNSKYYLKLRICAKSPEKGHNWLYSWDWPDMTYVDLHVTLTCGWPLSDLRTTLAWYLMLTFGFNLDYSPEPGE